MILDLLVQNNMQKIVISENSVFLIFFTTCRETQKMRMISQGARREETPRLRFKLTLRCLFLTLCIYARKLWPNFSNKWKTGI